MGFLKRIWTDFKTYYKINSVYPRQYKNSTIESYIVNESIIPQNIIIKKEVCISQTLTSIGEYSYIGTRSEILNCERIGRFVSISHDVKIGLDNHKLDAIGTNPIFYSRSREWVDIDCNKKYIPTVIENDVLISANAMIMSGITIGTGAVIGAGAFVNKDVPPYAIVVGIPARIIRYRFDEKTIERLLTSKWWEKSKNELLTYKDKFNNVPSFLEEIEK
ncbi:MAG: CatB-related O-acetyltransferase [Salinivirgaceae bacterium]|nr:CatB-related O-acetyltransferase [Salinivirgaceae bacterium]